MNTLSNLLNDINQLVNPPEFGTLFVTSTTDAVMSGRGSATDPIRVPAAPGHFDRVMQTFDKDLRWHRLHLYPGTYLTNGPWAYQRYSNTTRPVIISGESGATGPLAKIKLSAETAVFESGGQPRSDTRVLYLGPAWHNNPPSHVWNVELDGSEQELHHVYGTSAAEKRCDFGLTAHMNGGSVIGVVVRNLRGNHSRGQESFGILLNNFKQGANEHYDGGASILRCKIYNDGKRNDYFTGIYPGYVNHGVLPVAVTTVAGCQVISTDGVSKVAYSPQCGTNFRDNFCHNCHTAFYCDTNLAENVLIDGNAASGLVYTAVWLVSFKDPTAASASSQYKRNITIKNNVFSYAPVAGRNSIGFTYDAPTEPGCDNVLIDGNVFEAAPKAVFQIPFCFISIRGKATNVRLQNNVIPANSRMNILQPTVSSAIIFKDNYTPAGPVTAALPPI